MNSGQMPLTDYQRMILLWRLKLTVYKVYLYKCRRFISLSFIPSKSQKSYIYNISISNSMIKVRRVYDPEEAGEKYKVFVDRLWPRGISKEKAGWNEWMKEISPSNELRKWYSHDPANWKEFRKLYRMELNDRQNELSRLKLLEKEYGTITLLYSSKEEKYNNAIALRDFLTE